MALFTHPQSHLRILLTERQREYIQMKQPPSNRLDAILDYISTRPFIQRVTSLLNKVADAPIGQRMAIFAILWGLVGVWTRPFSFQGAEDILEAFVSAQVWSYGVLATGCIHIYAALKKCLWLYISALIVQCAIWWFVFAAFIMGGVPSAGVMTYGLIAVSATIALMRFDEGIR